MTKLEQYIASAKVLYKRDPQALEIIEAFERAIKQRNDLIRFYICRTESSERYQGVLYGNKIDLWDDELYGILDQRSEQ